MYLSDRRMVMLLQDLYNSKRENWCAEIEPVIRNFVGKLPKNIREVVEKRYGLTCDIGCQQVPQIAQFLNISQSEVSGFLTQGMTQIKKFLTEHRLNIIDLNPDSAVAQVIKDRVRLIPYHQGEDHRVEKLPPEFFETYRLEKFGLSSAAMQFLESLHMFLIGEIVIARPNEVELSPDCSDEALSEIRSMLGRFNLKRGMNITYEDFTNIFNKRREQEIMELSIAVTVHSMQKEMADMFGMDDVPTRSKKKKK